MKTDEFWQQVSDAIIECDDCPVSKLTPERYFCDQAGDCAGELRMLYEKLQKEERGEDGEENDRT